MRYSVTILGWFAIAVMASRALGHGNPIQVDLADGRLTIAHGLTMSNGFARLASDPHEDAALDSGPNQTLRSVYPGYDVAGLAANAALQLEIIGRPDLSTAGFPTRWLWFWDPTLQKVATAANNPAFDVVPLFGSGSIKVRQSQMVLGPTLTIADPIGPFLGDDQHLLSYRLQNSPSAALGVYGIFARLASPGLEPSEPFLLAFRYGVPVADFGVAAEAINCAAGLCGDYNRDNTIDAADYVVWRKTLGASEEYDVWRKNFGATIGGAGGGAELLANSLVPEPMSAAMIACAIVCGAIARRNRGLAVFYCGL